MYKKIILGLFSFFIAFQARAVEYSQEFQTCRGEARDDDALAECMKTETSRLMKEIQQQYLTLADMGPVKTWNKGVGLQKGNLRDMYNSWLAFRNRLCSLNKAVSDEAFYTPEYHYQSCMLETTMEHIDNMSSVLTTALESRDDPVE